MRAAALVAAAIAVAAVRAAAGGGGRLVEYVPHGFAPGGGWRPAAAALRADAQALAGIGAAAVLPVDAGVACRFLRRHGVALVFVAVDRPSDPRALRAAIRLARCAGGYVVDVPLAGDPLGRRGLEAAVGRLRATGRVVGVRAPAERLRADPSLAGAGDFTLAVVAADVARGAQEACGAAMQAYRDLERAAPRTGLWLVAGWPAPAGSVEEHRQRAYLLCLESRGIHVVVREAFDQPWRGGSEAHAGLFGSDGAPKRLAAQLLAPRLRPEARGGPGSGAAQSGSVSAGSRPGP